MPRAATELAKDWRTDRALRRLEALLAVVDAPAHAVVTGNGDVIQPTDGVLGIGSGGNYAVAAARALIGHSELRRPTIVRRSLEIAAGIDIYHQHATSWWKKCHARPDPAPDRRRTGPHIVGQDDAKRAVAVAIRNRWRRQQLPDEMRDEVAPKNILMIGPTGVGKTEIARRLARLTGAPFIKVEATKYTEVGYYGRDVESMIRELVEIAIALVARPERQKVEAEARRRAEERLLDLLAPPPAAYDTDSRRARIGRTPRSGRGKKCATSLPPARWKIARSKSSIEQKAMPMMLTGMGMEQMDLDLQGMFEKIMPKSELAPRDDGRRSPPGAVRAGMRSADQPGEGQRRRPSSWPRTWASSFIDEIDKVVASEGRSGPDVSRQGVQRDLLPIVEGTTVQTQYGYVKTDHILFIAAGAFHRAKPSDLMPELQGRFPIRVELKDLTKDDFVRILTEPNTR